MIGNSSSSTSTSSSDASKKRKQPKNESSALPTADSANRDTNQGDPSKSTPFKHTRLPASKNHPPPTSAEFWDIDLYFNRFVPAPRLHLLPSWISRLYAHLFLSPFTFSKPVFVLQSRSTMKDMPGEHKSRTPAVRMHLAGWSLKDSLLHTSICRDLSQHFCIFRRVRLGLLPIATVALHDLKNSRAGV